MFFSNVRSRKCRYLCTNGGSQSKKSLEKSTYKIFSSTATKCVYFVASHLWKAYIIFCPAASQAQVPGGERRRGGAWDVQRPRDHASRPSQADRRLPGRRSSHGGPCCLHIHQRRVLQRVVKSAGGFHCLSVPCFLFLFICNFFFRCCTYVLSHRLFLPPNRWLLTRHTEPG